MASTVSETNIRETTPDAHRLAWYAIRVTYSRELIVQRRLDRMGVESYVPMHAVGSPSGEGRAPKRVPLIHNLLFIRTDLPTLREIKADQTLPIRYIMDRETRRPAIIPDEQMQRFMAVVETRERHVEVVAPETVNLTQGDRVRVVAGPFAGVEGYYIRHKGHSKVAVLIDNIAVALTAYVPAAFIEKTTV